MGKKILIITGSPRAKGNSNTLVTAFASGAIAAGNEVEVFDAAKAKLDGCHGDKNCSKTGKCGLKDDGVQMGELMRWADVLVLASPVYWKSFTAQMKLAMDHFYQFVFPKGRATLTVKETALIATAKNPDPAIFGPMLESYELVGKLLDLPSSFELLCPGLDGPDDVKDHPEMLEAAVKYGMEI